MSENTTTTSTEQSIEQNGIPEITFEIDATTTVTQPTDPTLRNEGQPADAAAVGDAIDSIDGDIANLGTEISGLDGRLDTVEAAISPTSATGVLYKTDVDSTLAITGKAADAKATGDAISGLETTLTTTINTQIESGLESIPAALFPVGAIYITTLAAIPDGLPGTWVEIVMPLTWQNINAGTRGYTTAGESTPARTVHLFLRTE